MHLAVTSALSAKRNKSGWSSTILFAAKSLTYSLLIFSLLLKGTGNDAFGASGLKQTLLIAPVEIRGQNHLTLDELSVISTAITNVFEGSQKYLVQDQQISKRIEAAKKVAEACKSVENCAIQEARERDIELALITEINCYNATNCSLTMKMVDIETQKAARPSVTQETSPRLNDIKYAAESSALTMLTDTGSTVGTGQKRNILISSDPPGARIFIDQEAIGTSPWSGEISIGTHTLSLVPSSSSYSQINTRINVVLDESGSGIPQKEHFALGQVFTTVKVTVKPPNAELLLNGKPVDFRRTGGTLMLQSNTKAELKFSAATFLSKSIIISGEDLVPNGAYEVKAELKAEPAKVLFQSFPSAAVVLVDGEEIGRTPVSAELESSQGGLDHSIEFRKEGFDKHNETIRVNPGMSRQVSASLTAACFTEEEKELIATKKHIKTASYVGYGLSGALALGSVYFFAQMQGHYTEYKGASTPAAADAAWSKVQASQSTFITLGAASLGTLGVSYLLQTLGAFPKDLVNRERSCSKVPTLGSISYTPTDGVALSWCF
jgi:hypothetical protein